MSTAASLLLLLSCAGQETPPGPAARPSLDLQPGRGAPFERLLDRLDQAQLELSPDNLPPGAAAPSRYLLDTGWRQADLGDGRVWQHPSPVRLIQKRHSRQPTGLRMLVGERELDFDPELLSDPSKAQRWLLFEDQLLLVSRQPPSRWPEPPVLELSPAAEREADLNLERSGQPVADFALRQLSIGPLTHPCLYLPAPSSAELPVQVPAGGGTLRWSVGMAPTDDESAVGKARLVVSIDEQPVATSTALTGLAWSEEWLDLAPWAGQQVRLAFRSEPLDDPARDYLCVGSPILEHHPPADPDPVRVLVVGLDTLRPDHLSGAGYARPTSPELDALATDSFVFSQAWAPAPRTRPSFRSSTTGRWPLRAIGAPTLGQVLGPAGLATGGIVANVHLVPRLGFAAGFDSWHYDNGATAEQQVDLALQWLDRHRDQDSLLFLHLMDPHVFYLAPEPYIDRFTKGLERDGVPDRFNRWSVAEWEEQGLLSDAGRRFIAARYDGEIAYMDHQLGRLFAAVDRLPGRTLLVVHSDHGEELWDHGGFEHNHSLYQELTRAMLWIRPPGGLEGGPVTVEQPASLADLAPTLYEALGVPAPDHDGRSLWPLLDADLAARRPALEAELSQRALPLGHLMFDSERWGVVAADPQGRLHKYLLQTASGAEELYDLQADPSEQQDLAATADLAPWHAALARATEWPVGAGWRLGVDGATEPVRVHFAEPVRAAAVMDPEAARPRRANLEWGELSPIRPEDVGAVELSEDRRSLSFTPRGAPGTVLVVGGGSSAELVQGEARIEAGAVIIPLESEQAALARANGGAAEEDQLEALRQLGYVGD